MERDCGGRRRLIVVDGVFSMEGDVCALPEIVEIAREHGAALMVDDAHGIGVLGQLGRGTAEHFGVEDERAPDHGDVQQVPRLDRRVHRGDA